MESRRDADVSVSETSAVNGHFYDAAAAAFGEPGGWPAELRAAIAAVHINPIASVVWWGAAAVPLHNAVDGVADLLGSPAVLDAVTRLLRGGPDTGQLPIGRDDRLTARLRGLHELDGHRAGVLAVAWDTGAATAAYLDDLERAETRAANLQLALDSNRQIGVAIGILMAERKITQDAAFELMRSASQRQHRKLRSIAEDVILAGTLLEPAG